MTIYLVGAGILLCIICSAFFSATEMAYSTCNELRLENLSEEGNTRAKTALYITRHYDNALSTILIGNNLANIAGSSLASVFLILLVGAERADSLNWLATLIMTVIIIIFSETIPKITAKKNANKASIRYSFIIRGLMILLFPVVWLVVSAIRLITSKLKGSTEESADEAVEELQSIIETAEDEDVLDEDQSELVRCAIDFPEISAHEVMTARVDVFALDIKEDWKALLTAIEEAPFSRVPVYEGSIDNIIGVLTVNRFLKAMTESSRVDIRALLMQPVYVYKTVKLPTVLNELRKAKQHLAIVTDEYGGVLGVISMEDVLEQIVGEIWDENDVVEQEMTELGNGEYELDGDMSISDFLELAGIREDDFEADSDTVGGWTVESFGRYPQVGDSFSYENIRVKVLETDGHRVDRLSVIFSEKPEEE